MVKSGACFGQAFPERKKHGPISRQEAISHLNLLKKNPSDEATSSWCPHPCNGPAHVSIMQRQSSPAVAVDEAIQHWNQQTQIDIAPRARETFLSVVIHPIAKGPRGQGAKGPRLEPQETLRRKWWMEKFQGSTSSTQFNTVQHSSTTLDIWEIIIHGHPHEPTIVW